MSAGKTRPRATVSLVLGSGGARGLAHIGVIRWLVEHRFQICSISGASIGALVGGVFASGRLDEFERWVRGISKPMMIALMDLSWERGGLVKGERFMEALARYAPPGRIEDLPIAFTAVAAELATGKEIWLRSGDLLQAIRASISLPLLFTPYDHHGTLLIDGGVLNPVPIAPTFGDDTDLTIAVSLNGVPEMFSTPESAELEPDAGGLTLSPEIAQWIERIQTLFRTDDVARNDAPGVLTDTMHRGARAPGDIDTDRGLKGADDDAVPANGPRADELAGATMRRGGQRLLPSPRRDWSAYDVAYLAFDAMQGTIARQKLAAYPPDELVEISRSSARTLEFDRANALIDIGYREAARALSGLLDSPAMRNGRRGRPG